MYCENAIECCRSMLMNQFEQSPLFERPRFLHQCCDVCMKLCKCLDCEIIPPTAISTFERFEAKSPSISPAINITEEKH